jgi:hypothetical protein
MNIKSRVWITTELQRVLLDNLHRGYDGSYWSTGIKVSEKSVQKIYQHTWLWLNVEIQWFNHQLYSLLYYCSESWLTLVTRQRTQADMLGTLLKNCRIIRAGERKVVFKEAVICWDYIASTVFEWNISIQHRWNDSGREKPKCSEKNLSECHLDKLPTKYVETRYENAYFFLNTLSTKT